MPEEANLLYTKIYKLLENNKRKLVIFFLGRPLKSLRTIFKYIQTVLFPVSTQNNNINRFSEVDEWAGAVRLCAVWFCAVWFCLCLLWFCAVWFCAVWFCAFCGSVPSVVLFSVVLCLLWFCAAWCCAVWFCAVWFTAFSVCAVSFQIGVTTYVWKETGGGSAYMSVVSVLPAEMYKRTECRVKKILNGNGFDGNMQQIWWMVPSSSCGWLLEGKSAFLTADFRTSWFMLWAL